MDSRALHDACGCASCASSDSSAPPTVVETEAAAAIVREASGEGKRGVFGRVFYVCNGTATLCADCTCGVCDCDYCASYSARVRASGWRTDTSAEMPLTSASAGAGKAAVRLVVWDFMTDTCTG